MIVWLDHVLSQPTCNVGQISCAHSASHIQINYKYIPSSKLSQAHQHAGFIESPLMISNLSLMAEVSKPAFCKSVSCIVGHQENEDRRGRRSGGVLVEALRLPVAPLHITPSKMGDLKLILKKRLLVRPCILRTWGFHATPMPDNAPNSNFIDCYTGKFWARITAPQGCGIHRCDSRTCLQMSCPLLWCAHSKCAHLLPTG